MTLIDSPNDIEAFDEIFVRLTKDCPIRTGSISRLSPAALARWGIGVNDITRPWLAKRAEERFLKDVSDMEANPDWVQLTRSENRLWIERRMAGFMGSVVKELLKSQAETKDSLMVCDLPSREAQVSSAIASEMWGDTDETRIRDITRIFMVDANHYSIGVAKQNMKAYGMKHASFWSSDSEFFDMQEPGTFDVIVSMSFLHNKPYPEFLDQIYQLLADGGVFLVGDFHSAIWDHPCNTFNLLKRIGADGKTLDDFRALFGNELMAPDPNVRLTSAECQAINDHFKVWEDAAQAVKAHSSVIRPRLHFLGAHDTSKASAEKLEAAGFVTDVEKIRQAFPRSKIGDFPKQMLRDSDFAVVMMGMKQKLLRVG